MLFGLIKSKWQKKYEHEVEKYEYIKASLEELKVRYINAGEENDKLQRQLQDANNAAGSYKGLAEARLKTIEQQESVYKDEFARRESIQAQKEMAEASLNTALGRMQKLEYIINEYKAKEHRDIRDKIEVTFNEAAGIKVDNPTPAEDQNSCSEEVPKVNPYSIFTVKASAVERGNAAKERYENYVKNKQKKNKFKDTIGT